MLFAIADLHLSLGVDKPMDIFKGWTDYVSRLEKNWNAVVTDDDTVVIAGDISWALKISEAVEDFKFINSLKGKKIILKGNHDLWWQTAKKINDFFNENDIDTISILHNNAYKIGDVAIAGSRGWMFDSGEDKKVLLREAGRIRASIQKAKQLGCGTPIVFLHYPPIYKDAVCDEIMEVLKSEGITKCYYGHIHGAGANSAVRGLYDGIDFHLISCDTMDFTPLFIAR